MSKLPYRQVHLDFHTPKLSFELGKHFDKHQFQQTLQQAHVNSVTLTGRCHHGHIYYDTKLPAKHPQMNGDFLMRQVDACHEIGVRAPIYLTVGWDAYAADRHPEWLERKIDGCLYGFEDFGQLSPGWKTLCFNSPYLDYIKAQIIDTMQHFGKKLDGLFFDIVWQDPCYCNDCNQKMIEKGYDVFSEDDHERFAKETEQFLKDQIYLTVQSMAPSCPIFFNEGNILPSIRPNLHEYGHLEIESLPSGEWGYQHFPTVVCYAKNLGKEYLGMTGKFHKVWSDFGSYKNQVALEYETFLAIAHGAKCSIGDQMYPDGTLQSATYDLIGSVYKQVESVEHLNDETKAVTEIAILHPGVSSECKEKVDLSLAGAVNMLSEAHYQFDVIDHLMDWHRYRVIILPDKISYSLAIQEKVSDYLGQGGKILASYQSGLDDMNQFPSSWGIDYRGVNDFVPTYGRYEEPLSGRLPSGEIVLHGESLNVTVSSANVLGQEICPMYQRDFQHYYAHFQAPAGEASGYPVVTKSDSVIYFTHAIFEMYKFHGVRQYKLLVLAALADLMDEQRVVETNLPTTADVILNHKQASKQLVINLLHYIPQRKAVSLDTIEDKIILRDIEVVLNMAEIAALIGTEIVEIESAVDLENKRLIYRMDDHRKITIEVPEIDGYQIVIVTYKSESGALWKD